MEKAPDAFRTISEVAADLDVPQHVLRFWESRFREIRPMKRGGGRRYYRPDDIDLLRGIRHLLYGEGYTIRGVQRILKEQGLKFVQTVWQPGAARPAHRPSDEADVAEDADDIGNGASTRGRGLFGLLPSLIGGPDEGEEQDDDMATKIMATKIMATKILATGRRSCRARIRNRARSRPRGRRRRSTAPRAPCRPMTCASSSPRSTSSPNAASSLTARSRRNPEPRRNARSAA